jgi:paraquat-inducible protein B
MINFDFKPDEPLNITGIKSDYPELPTIPSDMAKLSRTIENIPFEELINKLLHAVKGLDSFLNSPELVGTFKSAEQALNDVQKLVKHVDTQIIPLATNIKNTSNSVRSTFEQAEKTLALEEGVPGELASGIKETLTSAHDTFVSARNALKETEQTLAKYKEVASPNSDLMYEVNNAMKELAAAARSIRFMTDYLNRHPEALLRGKGSSKGE